MKFLSESCYNQSVLNHHTGKSKQSLCHIRIIVGSVVHNFLSKRMLEELKKSTNFKTCFPCNFYRGHIFLYPENFAVSAWLLYWGFLLFCITASSLGVTSHKKRHYLAASFTSQSRTY